MNIFGFNDYEGLLSDKDISAMNSQALTNAGLAMMANSTQLGYKPRLGQLLAQGYQAGQQGGQGALQNKLSMMSLKDKMDERKQAQATKERRNAMLSQIGTASPEQIKQGISAALQVGDIETAKTLNEVLKNLTPEQLKPTSDMQNFGMAQQNPAFAQFLKDGRKGTVINNNIGGENEFDKAVAKGDATVLSDLMVAGHSAARKGQMLDDLETALAKGGSGLGPTVTAMAGSFGLNIGEGEQLDNLQAAEAIISQLVPQQRPPGSGTMSDADLALFKRSLPSLINTPEGNQKILSTIRAINQYDKEIGAIAVAARNNQISRQEAFNRIQNVRNPLAGFSAPKTTAPAVVDFNSLK